MEKGGELLPSDGDGDGEPNQSMKSSVNWHVKSYARAVVMTNL